MHDWQSASKACSRVRLPRSGTLKGTTIMGIKSRQKFKWIWQAPQEYGIQTRTDVQVKIDARLNDQQFVENDAKQGMSLETFSFSLSLKQKNGQSLISTGITYEIDLEHSLLYTFYIADYACKLGRNLRISRQPTERWNRNYVSPIGETSKNSRTAL